jgi:hypothetical protein
MRVDEAESVARMTASEPIASTSAATPAAAMRVWRARRITLVGSGTGTDASSRRSVSAA